MRDIQFKPSQETQNKTFMDIFSVQLENGKRIIKIERYVRERIKI